MEVTAMRGTIGAGALCLLLFTGCNDATKNLEVFQADLNTTNEVPPRGTGANGAAGFTWDGTTMSFTLQVDDIASVTQAHIHSGAAGVNGPVRVFLYRPGALVSASDTTILSSGSFTAKDVSIPIDTLLAEMRAGTAYVNVHTSAFPGGEMRGQVRLLAVN
jgi:hypothetical protein